MAEMEWVVWAINAVHNSNEFAQTEENQSYRYITEEEIEIIKSFGNYGEYFVSLLFF